MAHQHPATQQTVMLTRSVVLILVSSAVAAFGGSTTRAAELAEQAHSLRVVPEDAAFYSVSLRLKEQLDNFLASNTYDKVMQIPVIQLAKQQISFQWDQAALPGVAPVKDYLESPQGKEALALLKEMFSDEVFVYGSGDVTASLELFMELNSLRRTARLEALASGEDPNEFMGQRVMEVLEEHAEDFKVPSIVMGMRIEDKERAEGQLDEVHSFVRHFFDEHHPELSAHLQRDQIGGHEFLTLRLDGSMIPWDEIREQGDMDAEQIEKWQELLNNKTLAVALGVVDEFVLLSVGDSTDHLETFGEGESIVEQQAVKRLNKHADERIVSVGYVSKALTENISSPEQTIEDLAAAAGEMLHAAEVSEEQREKLVADIRGLGDQLKKYMPEAGDTAMVTFLSDRGYEAFQYSYGSRPTADSSKPLTILNHVGAKPLLIVAAKSKEDPEDYEQAVEWVKRIAVQVEEIAESKAEPEQWEKYQQYRDRGIELLRRLDRVNREHLIPAFQDGQWAFVMDTSPESKRWMKQMPESPKPLPMLEMAFVAGVSDAEHLQQGVRELFDIVGDTMAMARDIHPEDVPEVELPEPEKRELDNGDVLYAYPLPEAWGLDRQVAPNAGLGESVAVVSAFPATTEKLLRDNEFDVESSIDFDRPAAMASHVEIAKGIETIRPWIDYGFDVAIGKLKVEEDEDEDENGEEDEDENEEDGDAGEDEGGEDEEEVEADAAAEQQRAAIAMQMGFFMPQVHQFLELATALRSFSSVTYEEDGVWVTHSETHLEDVE